MPLYIKDIEVDISEKFAFPLTYEISDITDITKRKGNSSKTITLPGTQRNVNLMSQIFTLSTTDKITGGSPFVFNIDPSVKTDARYYDEESNVLLFKGLCQVLECRKKDGEWEFDILLFSEQIDFMSELSKYKVNELGFDEYNHTWNRARIEDSWTGTIRKNGAAYSNVSGGNWLGEGYYYGLIEHGYDRPQVDAFQVEHIPPQTFLKTIVDKMFTKAGFSYSSNFFDSQLFKKLLVPFQGGKIPNVSPEFSANYSIETDMDNPSTSSGALETTHGLIYTGSVVNKWYINTPEQNSIFPIEVQSGTVVDPSGQIQSNAPLTFNAINEGYYTFTFSGDFDIDTTFNPTGGSGSYTTSFNNQFSGRVLVNGVNTFSTNLGNFLVTGTSLTNSQTVTFTWTVPMYLYSNDQLTFEIFYNHGNFAGTFFTDDNESATACTLDTLVTATGVQLDITYDVQVLIPNNTIDIKYFLPDMKADVFFKGIVNMFNLYIKPSDTTDKQLIIEPLNDFYSGSNNDTNWTELVDEEKDITVTPTVNLSKKNYMFRFKDDKDYWNVRYNGDTNRQYGEYVVTSTSEFVKGDEKHELPFSQKPLVQITGTDLIIPHNYTVKTSNSGLSEVVPKKGNPYIVQIKSGTPGTLQTGSWYLIDEYLTSYAKTSYPYVGHLDDLNSPGFDLLFGVPQFVFFNALQTAVLTTNNLYVYHERFIKQIISRNGKLLKCNIRLTPNHINTLDMGRLINLDGVVYRLQKIKDFDSRDDDSTACEFVRLVEAEDFTVNTIEEAQVQLEVYDDPYVIPSDQLKLTEDGSEKLTEDGENKRIE